MKRKAWNIGNKRRVVELRIEKSGIVEARVGDLPGRKRKKTKRSTNRPGYGQKQGERARTATKSVVIALALK